MSAVLLHPMIGTDVQRPVQQVAKALWQLGCAEISLGDTIGVGLPSSMESMLNSVVHDVPIESLAG